MATTTSRRLVIFGAGAVGRGFIGELFADAGWTVSFLDVQPELIETLRRDASYRHRTVAEVEQVKTVAPVEAGYSTDREHVMAEVEAATCVATSVGARVLPLIAPLLRDALIHRYAAGGGPLDVLLCENLHDAGAIMRDLLTAGLDDDSAALVTAKTGLIETSIGRMIPVTGASRGSLTEVAVEPYRFLPIDIAATKTAVFDDVPGLVRDLSVDFSFYGDRKLYVHNMGHFLCALLGRREGYEEIWQAVQEPTIRYLTRAAMIESAIALSATYGYHIGPLVDHVDDLLHRFENRALADTIERVARDPQRKMEPGDRLIGALRSALRAGTPSGHLAFAVGLGAWAWRSAEGVATEAVAGHLAAALDDHPGDLALVMRHSQALGSSDGLGESFGVLGARFDPPSIP